MGLKREYAVLKKNMLTCRGIITLLSVLIRVHLWFENLLAFSIIHFTNSGMTLEKEIYKMQMSTMSRFMREATLKVNKCN